MADGATRSIDSERDEGIRFSTRDGWSLPPATYVDPATFEREQQRVFAKSWIPVIRANDLPEVGDYVTTVIAGEPLIVVRRKDGTLNALSNVCRHRSMLMLEGAGHAPAIQCPYHHWVYNLDGTLRGAPFMKGAPAFAAAECQLPRYRVEEWMGWVFVNLDADAEPLAPALQEIAAKLPADLASWVSTSETRFDSPFNWKVIVENGSESYHNIGSHTGTIQPAWPGGQSRPVATDGAYLEIRHPNDPTLGTFAAYTIFPYMTFTVQEPDPNILWYDLRVNGIADCEMVLRVLMPPHRAADAEHVELVRQTVAAIHQEDITACGKVQRGVAAPSAVSGPLSPLEATLGTFHNWLDARMN